MPACDIIPFPARNSEPDAIREAIWQLERHELLPVASNLIRFADVAAHLGDDRDFYDRVRAAHLALERILLERDRV